MATSDNGIFLFPPGEPLRPSASFLPATEITSLLEDSQGRIWYGTPQAVGWLDNGPDPAGHPVTGVPLDTVTAVTEDSKGRIWATTFNGALYVITSAGVRVLGAREGLPGQQLYRLIDDGAGSLWVSSPKGILRIGSEQVDELLRGSRSRLSIPVYDGEDGMRTMECHRLSQPAGWKDPRGGVWFPTTSGFVHVAPGTAGAPIAPQVRLEEATVGGRTFAPGAGIQLTPGVHAIEIRYTALRFAWPDKVHFRYRLQGFDPDWVEAGTQRVARYSRVPPGDYRFLVSAGTPGGRWTPEPVAIAVHQMPQFHQTRWFIALLALASIGIAAGLFRWRVLIIKGRYAAVLAERSRIAREWHDTLLAGFAAITWQLEETLSRLREMPEQASVTVELALKMVQHYRAEARRVIWDLRESRPESETLADAVTIALRQLTEGTRIGGSVETAGSPVRLANELERNILRICQEAVSNAKRHANPRQISIRLDYRPKCIQVRIADDGQGFVPGEVRGLTSGHFGLAVMRERAERFGGRLQFSSQPGQGTIIEATIPCAPMASQ